MLTFAHMEIGGQYDPFRNASRGQSPLALRLGDAPYGPESGRVGVMNSLARSGLPIAEGVVLMEECHRSFLESSGLAWDLLACGDGTEVRKLAQALRRRYRRCTLKEELKGVIRAALAEIGGRSVAVVSEDMTRTGLRSIPRVEEAVLRAWLSPNGLRRQVGAAMRGGEIPLWPVLIQHELHDG
ncbi:MAG TPA: hypothetical protein VFJ72_14095 [Rubrobacteraceae bacterium]|nr:hypothetical protein [Rubrobacteraceae bacterium]